MNKCNIIKTDNNEVHCHYGKLCEVNPGLRGHQRFFQISDILELRELFKKDLLENSLIEYDGNIDKNIESKSRHKIESKSRHKTIKN